MTILRPFLFYFLVCFGWLYGTAIKGYLRTQIRRTEYTQLRCSNPCTRGYILKRKAFGVLAKPTNEKDAIFCRSCNDTFYLNSHIFCHSEYGNANTGARSHRYLCATRAANARTTALGRSCFEAGNPRSTQ